MVEGYSLKFEWEGGEYIDISFVNKEGVWGCINTFKDNEKIEFRGENFEKEIDEWINDPEVDPCSRSKGVQLWTLILTHCYTVNLGVGRNCVRLAGPCNGAR